MVLIVWPGQRRADLARQFGYADGSGVLHAVQRLEARAKDDARLRRTLCTRLG